MYILPNATIEQLILSVTIASWDFYFLMSPIWTTFKAACLWYCLIRLCYCPTRPPYYSSSWVVILSSVKYYITAAGLNIIRPQEILSVTRPFCKLQYHPLVTVIMSLCTVTLRLCYGDIIANTGAAPADIWPNILPVLLWFHISLRKGGGGGRAHCSQN
jgi:hypothetical protein